jgi:hypothetical protein
MSALRFVAREVVRPVARATKQSDAVAFTTLPERTRAKCPLLCERPLDRDQPRSFAIMARAATPAIELQQLRRPIMR